MYKNIKRGNVLSYPKFRKIQMPVGLGTQKSLICDEP